MSSAISTKRGLPAAPAVPGRPDAPPQAGQDAGFQPWHFFVLASLAAATVAVLMSRQSAPEHLILISLMIAAAGGAAAGVYRMLAPLTARDTAFAGQRQSDRARAALEREKGLVLRSIKELEFDRAMGKVSPRDFDEMSARLRARAMMLIRQADEGGSGYRELIERELSARLVTRALGAAGRPGAVASADEGTAAAPERSEPAFAAAAPTRTAAPACAACGTANDADAAFCKRCGTALDISA